MSAENSLDLVIQKLENYVRFLVEKKRLIDSGIAKDQDQTQRVADDGEATDFALNKRNEVLNSG